MPIGNGSPRILQGLHSFLLGEIFARVMNCKGARSSSPGVLQTQSRPHSSIIFSNWKKMVEGGFEHDSISGVGWDLLETILHVYLSSTSLNGRQTALSCMVLTEHTVRSSQVILQSGFRLRAALHSTAHELNTYDQAEDTWQRYFRLLSKFAF